MSACQESPQGRILLKFSRRCSPTPPCANVSPEMQQLYDISDRPSVAILEGFHPSVTSLSCQTVRSVSSDSHSMPSSGDVTFKVRTWACSSHDMTPPSCQLAERVHGQRVKWLGETKRKRFSERHFQQALWKCEKWSQCISVLARKDRAWLGEKRTMNSGCGPKLNWVCFGCHPG